MCCRIFISFFNSFITNWYCNQYFLFNYFDYIIFQINFSFYFFQPFYIYEDFPFFDSITYNLISNFLFQISKLRLTFPKAIISFLFTNVNILLLDSFILTFNLSNKVLIIILVDVSVLIIILISQFLILNLLYNSIIL